jgi:hypothetical protein
MDHSEAIRSQIRELEAEVRKDPRLAVIEHLKAALSLLEGMGAAAAVRPDTRANPDAPTQNGAAASPSQPATAPRSDTKIRRFYDTVGRHIDEHGPTHRTALVQMLTEASLMDGIKDPLSALATTMNTLREYFVSDGHGTFRRREGAPRELVPLWTKKGGTKKGNRRTLSMSSPQGEPGADDPGPIPLTPNDERAVTSGAEAGGT